MRFHSRFCAKITLQKFGLNRILGNGAAVLGVKVFDLSGIIALLTILSSFPWLIRDQIYSEVPFIPQTENWQKTDIFAGWSVQKFGLKLSTDHFKLVWIEIVDFDINVRVLWAQSCTTSSRARWVASALANGY